jgi:hypothetical protein
MNPSQIYILTGIIVLAGIMAVFTLTRKKIRRPLSPLVSA